MGVAHEDAINNMCSYHPLSLHIMEVPDIHVEFTAIAIHSL